MDAHPEIQLMPAPSKLTLSDVYKNDVDRISDTVVQKVDGHSSQIALTPHCQILPSKEGEDHIKEVKFTILNVGGGKNYMRFGLTHEDTLDKVKENSRDFIDDP